MEKFKNLNFSKKYEQESKTPIKNSAKVMIEGNKTIMNSKKNEISKVKENNNISKNNENLKYIENNKSKSIQDKSNIDDFNNKINYFDSKNKNVEKINNNIKNTNISKNEFSNFNEIKKYNNSNNNVGVNSKSINKYNMNQQDQLNNQFNDLNLDFKNPMFPHEEKSTKIFGKVKDKNDKDTYHMYEVATKKADELENPFTSKKKSYLSKEEEEIVKQVFLSGINQNKMTLGTKLMMDAERTHAIEAIECGIYVNWVNNLDFKNPIECMRIGSKSTCFCGHSFVDHDKIVTSKKFSSKCQNCKCKNFLYIPQVPEEVGEYWLGNRKGFKYLEWKAKCKCKHGWDEHRVEDKKCRECNCYGFNSAFCCVVCNRFWQEHEVVYELRKERIELKKPVDSDYLPLQEAKDIQEAVYLNIDKSKPKQLFS